MRTLVCWPGCELGGRGACAAAGPGCRPELGLPEPIESTAPEIVAAFDPAWVLAACHDCWWRAGFVAVVGVGTPTTATKPIRSGCSCSGMAKIMLPTPASPEPGVEHVRHSLTGRVRGQRRSLPGQQLVCTPATLAVMRGHSRDMVGGPDP
jgi:hypothetical protein